jgi:hypothetical protein
LLCEVVQIAQCPLSGRSNDDVQPASEC